MRASNLLAALLDNLCGAVLSALALHSLYSLLCGAHRDLGARAGVGRSECHRHLVSPPRDVAE